MGATGVPTAPKERRRNSEKRKEKSRDAARCRRSKESEIFSALSQQLPLAESVSSQLDKASVMRLAISYLRMHEILEPIADLADTGPPSPFDGSMLEALDGVLLVLSADGDVLFLTENVGRHLGLNQVDLMGQSLFEFCHPCDHDELREALCPGTQSQTPEQYPQPCSFFMRLKCALGSKGRGVSVKSASSYKVMHCVGNRVLRDVAPASCHREDDHDEEDEEQEVPDVVLEENGSQPLQAPCKEKRRFVVCVAQPIPHPSNIEVPLGARTFLSRHSPSMRFTHVDDR